MAIPAVDQHSWQTDWRNPIPTDSILHGTFLSQPPNNEQVATVGGYVKRRPVTYACNEVTNFMSVLAQWMDDAALAYFTF